MIPRNALCCNMIIAVAVVGFSVAPYPLYGDADRIAATLEKMAAEESWGEVVLKSGKVRAIQVVSIEGEEISVREVVGALHERPATYSLDQLHSIRELGNRRIAMRPAAYQPRRSLLAALLIETPIPGGGFFYIGESRQGFSLLLFSAAAAGTGFLAGREGAAGWVPIVAWTKLASLLHLRDQVGAINAYHERQLEADTRYGEAGRTPSSPPFLRLGFRF